VTSDKYALLPTPDFLWLDVCWIAYIAAFVAQVKDLSSRLAEARQQATFPFSPLDDSFIRLSRWKDPFVCQTNSVQSPELHRLRDKLLSVPLAQEQQWAVIASRQRAFFRQSRSLCQVIPLEQVHFDTFT